jgi:multiple sugar transport system substrate-binding protein
LRTLHPSYPYIRIIEPLIPEFEALTGIKVDLETLPETAMRQKLTVELVAKNPNVDQFPSMSIQEGFKYHKAGWYTDLEKFAMDPNLTNPDYDFADFTPAALDVCKVKGMLVGIPEISNTQMFYQRKDILQKYGIKVDTLEELEAAAKKLTGIEKDFYGITMRGRAAAATSQWSSFLYSFGGSWLHPDGSPAMNTPEALKAFDLYGRLVREYAPPGSINNTWQQCLPIFTNGRAAMWIDGAPFSGTVTDPKESKIAEHVGFAPFPKGPAGSKPFINNWMWCISPFSEKKEAAWYFIQWATSKEMDKKVALAGIAPTRKSTWEFEGYIKSGFPAAHPDYLNALRTNLMNAHPYQSAPVEPVNEFRDIVGTVIVAAIQNEDIKKAADEANKQLEELLSKYR